MFCSCITNDICIRYLNIPNVGVYIRKETVKIVYLDQLLLLEIRRHADVSVGLIFGKDPTQSNKHKYRNSKTVSVTDFYISHRKIYHRDFYILLNVC